MFVVMVHGKTLQIITDAIKTCGSIHSYTFFIMLHKFSEDSCIQWLQHATVEHRLSKTVLLCRPSELFAVFICVMRRTYELTNVEIMSSWDEFQQQRIHCTSSVITGK